MEKTKKNTPVFVLKIVGNVIFYLVIAFLLLFSIMNINGGNKNEGFPNIFGTGILSVQSNSMAGNKEDSFNKGDLLIVDVFEADDWDDLEVGDIVTFYDDYLGALNSHRIVFISNDGSLIAVQGDVSVGEYGAYNPLTMDPSMNKWLEDNHHVALLSAEDVLGVTDDIWRGAGKTLDALQKYWLIIFVLPVFIFLMFEIFMVYKNVQELKAEKQKALDADKSADDLEAQKAALRAQILAEIEAEKQKEALKAEILAEIEAEKEKNNKE